MKSDKKKLASSDRTVLVKTVESEVNNPTYSLFLGLFLKRNVALV